MCDAISQKTHTLYNRVVIFIYDVVREVGGVVRGVFGKGRGTPPVVKNFKMMVG